MKQEEFNKQMIAILTKMNTNLEKMVINQIKANKKLSESELEYTWVTGMEYSIKDEKRFEAAAKYALKNKHSVSLFTDYLSGKYKFMENVNIGSTGLKDKFESEK